MTSAIQKAALRTRRPTGKAPWPILLIAGAEKTGKSWACAAASASDMIGRTFWVSCGEDDPDEYGAIPGARFEIVEHDGTYRGILTALTLASQQEAVDGKPNLIVFDSASRLWALLSDMGQAEANRRDRVKAEKFKRKPSEEDVPISMDLWNAAKDRWQDVLDTMRAHQGPSIITARLDLTTVMDGEKPTKEKVSKVIAEKHLPFDVGAVVEMPARDEAYLTGVRSVKMSADSTRRKPLRDFTVEKLWQDLGLAVESGTRTHVRSDGQGSQAVEDELPVKREALLEKIKATAAEKGLDLTTIASDWWEASGTAINQTADLEGLETYANSLAGKPLTVIQGGA